MKLNNLTHFFNKRVYTVPSYQRGYSWEKKQVMDLLNDLDYAIRLNHEHYAGTITLHEQKEKVKIGLNNYINFNLVDGQQRFTTIILLISFLLQELKKNKKNAEDAEKKLEIYIKNKEEYIFNYEVDSTSNSFFRAMILENEHKWTKDENVYTRNLSNARNLIKEYFKKPENKNRILQFLNALEEQLQFNEYIVDDSSQIGVVFETMNNRGIGLSTLELVKNRLLYLNSKIPLTKKNHGNISRLSKEINEYWSNILHNLTLPNKVLDEDQFLANHWIMYYGWSKDNLAKEQILNKEFTISNIVDKPDTIETKIRAYIKSLATCSLFWRYINYPEEENAFKDIKDSKLREEIIDYSKKLNRLNNSNIRPILLAYSHIANKNPERYLEICKLAELYSFRLFSMNRRRSDTGKNDFFKDANKIYKNINRKKYFEYTMYLFAWYIDEYGDLNRFETEVEELFNSSKKDGYYSWAGLTYFLYEYEESLRKKNEPKVDYRFAQLKAKSIEHIYPQTPTCSYWRKNFKFKKNERKRILHSLGNLLLISTDKNSELRNLDFPTKSRGENSDSSAYVNGSYSEIEIVRKNRLWNKTKVLTREKELLRFLKERWLIDAFDFEDYNNPFEDVEILDDNSEEELD
ncbi:MAG: DUF262 domain-containing protein [Ignavibacteriae bacterium]|nr:DUF262 domain-containing protein [Ignavibacteriota bacterium]NOH00380.1 DUF262 domain-containing protein [Ignavibacteriota bacterium]